MKSYLIFILLATMAMLTSCSPQKTLYSWGNYQEDSYKYAKEENEETLDRLIVSYEKVLNNQEGIRKEVPPGLCADYGYLLIKKGKTPEGVAMLKKEIALYPESGFFISRIIKQLEE